MAERDIITMTQRELKRLHIIHKVLDKRLKQVEAKNILGLCERQIRRIAKRVKQEGESGITHKSRGKASHNKIPEKTKLKVIDLYKGKYKGFGPLLFSEKLSCIEKIKISDETLRNWLIDAREWTKRRKHKQHRQWRERKHHPGEMIQVDGSHHDWFEGRGEKCVLMGYIDDATGNVFAWFYEYEGTYPFMDSFKRYTRKYGLPHSIYIDKHRTYKSTKKPSIDDQLENREPLSQVGRALKELSVEVIYAHSAQAKGRVERLFRTFQDRVIKEMRLKGIKTIKEANKFLKCYLPIYNKRFRVKPIRKTDLHRSLPKHINLNSILSVKIERALRNDFTVAHNKKLYQVFTHTISKKVIVEERINGTMLITYNGRPLKYKQIAQRPLKAKPEKLRISKPKKPYIPSKNHPYKSFKVSPYARINSYPQEEQEEKELLLVH